MDSDNFRMLVNYGKWARYFGCKGYPTNTKHYQSYVITDKQALFIDAKLGEIKKRAKDYYLIFVLYFIHGIEAKRLKTELSRIAPVYANDYKSFTASDFEALIDRMGDFIFSNESK